ncbi:MAG: hypothetical protein PHG00_01345 [Methylococcales bacterium]|nr:hypothetical protein [Methylococcales bacterium]
MNSLHKTLTITPPFFLAGLLLCASAHGTEVNTEGQDLVPTGKGRGELPDARRKNRELNRAKRGGSNIQNNGITYHGGPVMLGPTNVYYIWYGDWSGNTATTILTDLANSIGRSRYFRINTSYYNESNLPVSTEVYYNGSISTDAGIYGTSLSDANIKSIVSDAIISEALPADANAVYFVLTSAEVNASSGFCTQYCGWHAHDTISGVDIKYSFVGNPDRCPSSCSSRTKGPNGNAGADGMASIIAHELEETVTDPNLNAWYDNRGYENADKCSWKYGSTYATPNGAVANMKVGNRDYLIQQNWANAKGGYCTLSY